MKELRPVALALLVASLAVTGVAQYRGTYIPKYGEPFTAAASLAPLAQPADLAVDASQAWRGILTVTESIPARPGPFTVVYPQWVPGEHGPTGPIDELAALRFTAGTQILPWNRDPVNMYAFHITVPAGAGTVTAHFDLLMNDGTGKMQTHKLAIINWNRVLLYQAGVDSHTYFFRPSITLPAGWSYGTALTVAATPAADHVQFAPLTLAMLVDSPLDMGQYAKKWDLGKLDGAGVQLDAFANNPRDLDIPSERLAAYQRVPAEAFALYGSRHFANYHALLTLSDAIGFQGIEHHQSSDNRAPADFLTNPQESLGDGDLITHEMSHSWNGKYRRPADLTTPNFQVPMQTELLWVYEGMNQYLGDMLSFRAGIRKPSDYPEYLATLFADMSLETGRATTPVAALTTAAPYLYQASNDYSAISRNAGDFYTEGELVWLDADTIIRTLSHGTKSLDDFLHLYSAPEVTDPITDTYTRAQIEALLNQVQPYDWHAFLQRHLYDIAPQPPLNGLQRAGWKLVYTAKPNKFDEAYAALNHGDSIHWYDLGLTATSNGTIKGVRRGTSAWNAGLADGDRIIAVNGHAYSGDELDAAVEQAQHSTAPITLEVQGSNWLQTLKVNYHEGLRYPHLERLPGTTDLLAAIMAPHAK